MFNRGFPGGRVAKNLPANAADPRDVETSDWDLNPRAGTQAHTVWT